VALVLSCIKAMMIHCCCWSYAGIWQHYIKAVIFSNRMDWLNFWPGIVAKDK